MRPGESLAKHTWQVLHYLRTLAERHPVWSEIGALPDGSAFWPVVFWAAFFHDWGKVAPSFQQVLRGKGRWSHRHEVLSLAFLDWVKYFHTPGQMDGMTAAIVSHHLDENEVARLYPLNVDPEFDSVEDLVREIDDDALQGLWRWFSEIAPVWIHDLEFDKLGVTAPDELSTVGAYEKLTRFRMEAPAQIRERLWSFCSLVGKFSYAQGKEWALPGILLRGSLIESDHAASAHVPSARRLELTHESILAGEVSQDKLFEHQKNVANVSGSCILIAPTGSGKTEAALLWACRQWQDGCMSRLHYTLPYQASMNAMRERIERYFPESAGLVHSRSALAVYRTLMEQGYDPVSAARAAKLADQLARLRYHPIQISSPYQMLKAAYQLKGYEAILADLAGGAFIFDEIHAYDPSRLALTLELSSFLREKLGCRFLVMSATLPSHVRRRVEEALESPPVVRASDTLFREFSRHRLHLVDDELLSDGILTAIVREFQKGRSVLVTCNTVKRAQDVYRRLCDSIPRESLVLVHSRFNSRDRIRKETSILKATGTRSDERRTMVVVSTQVVEVSLNIDLDVLFSDPAPLEALVQRFGRINRLRRVDKAPVYVCTQPADGQGVYLSSLVRQTLSTLEKHANGKDIEERSVEMWLDEVYTGEPLEEWEEKYRKTQMHFRKSCLNRLYPFRSMEELEEIFDKMFDGTEVIPSAYHKEYLELREVNPFQAAELLVPVSWAWLKANEKRRLPSKHPWTVVVDVRYSAEYGLEV